MKHEALARGDFARLAYRLGRVQATGVLTISLPRTRPEVLVLRRGHLITTDQDVTGRLAHARLGRIAVLHGATATFDGGTAAYPPGASGRAVPLAQWARAHLESQVDATRADQIVRELAGARVVVRVDQAPEPVDESDRRMLAAMNQPRRLDQIWPLARTPRFRLLAFLHFLRAVGALAVVGVGASAPGREHDPRTHALRMLGVDPDASQRTVRRAYHQTARQLHPDLQPGISDERRRELESRLAAVTDAYRSLTS